MGLLDKIKDDHKEYILIRKAIELIGKVSNTPENEVIEFLAYSEIMKSLPIYCMNDNKRMYRVEQGKQLDDNEVLFSYFKKSELEVFEPLRKYDLFANERGYYYIAKTTLGKKKVGDRIIGLSDSGIERLLDENAIEKVFIEQPDSDSLATIEKQKQYIADLEIQLSKFQTAAPDDVVSIPFGKRIDLINKDLPQDERLKESYQVYSNDFSFHEDKHPVNTPDEMIERIQGLLKVIKRKDSKILELEQQTNTPANAQAEIDELKEQLNKANTELAAAKTTTTDQPLDWQNMSEHVYPPELHLALMIWQRIYADEELKESHPHITSHARKFELIAKRMNLDPDKELGKRIEKITNIAYTKNGQTLLAVPLHAVKGLHMPPIKEKTTP